MICVFTKEVENGNLLFPSSHHFASHCTSVFFFSIFSFLGSANNVMPFFVWTTLSHSKCKCTEVVNSSVHAVTIWGTVTHTSFVNNKMVAADRIMQWSKKRPDSPFENPWWLYIYMRHLNHTICDSLPLIRATILDQCHNRGFSCDVIISKFCRSSYLRPPCCFPFPVER